MSPPTSMTTSAFQLAKGIVLMSVVARPVWLRAVPRAKPPATIQRTAQLICSRCLAFRIPVAENTANGIIATILELTLNRLSPTQRMIVRANVTQTTYFWKGVVLIGAPSILSSIDLALNG